MSERAPPVCVFVGWSKEGEFARATDDDPFSSCSHCCVRRLAIASYLARPDDDGNDNNNNNNILSIELLPLHL